MARIGVIDLGSNTIRLVVYEVGDTSGRALGAADFKALINEKKIAGLSAYVEDGVLAQGGIDKAASVVAEHLETAYNLGCEQVDIIATAVLRNCKNSAEAVSAIEEATGHAVRVLSGEEESLLSCAGARLTNPFDDGLLIDIGGGSTELVHVEGGAPIERISLDQGCVSSYADYVEVLFPTELECAAIELAAKARIEAAIAKRLLPDLAFPTAYGVGGGVRAAAKMAKALRGSAQPRTVTCGDLAEILSALRNDPAAFAHAAVKAVPERLHSLVPGVLILKAVMDRFSIEEIRVSKTGLREGWLAFRS